MGGPSGTQGHSFLYLGEEFITSLSLDPLSHQNFCDEGKSENKHLKIKQPFSWLDSSEFPIQHNENLI